ncbi:hypothetical protein [Aquibium microcysteis]|uniref:hypothetical protein n=1 Tax=Aquibium microcysteis TaxID=675281 RepID=UPI00165D1F22|nr:hypothetical protein [Aquibium microcysteis]
MRLPRELAAPYADALSRVIAADERRGADPDRIRRAQALLIDVRASSCAPAATVPGAEMAKIVDLAAYRRERLAYR